MAGNAEVLAAFEAAMRSGDYGKLQELAQRYATDDFMQEWPQSGERLSKEGTIRLAESYPELSGMSPVFTFKRMLTGGDLFVLEGTIDYGDGVPVSYAGIGELRDGMISRMTEYFANPFEAPAWRADFVEKS